MSDFHFNLQDSQDNIMNDHQLQRFFMLHQPFSEHSDTDPSSHSNSHSIEQKSTYMDVQSPKSKKCSQKQRKRKRIRRKRRGKEKDKRKDYRKNICGYIIRKIIRQFTTQTYREEVQQFCLKNGCEYDEAIHYYYNRMERVTGPSHIPELLLSEREKQKGVKKAFSQFLLWFLRERYVRYLLTQGKMSDKEEYIRVKNKKLIQLISQILDKNSGQVNLHYL